MRRTIFAAAMALASAQLFLVQPMVARLLLPIVGGSTLVWSAALVFFQMALLVGYALAHLEVRLRGGRADYMIGLVVAGALVLPFAAPESPPSWSSPSTWVWVELAKMLGAPFVLLAAASPLLQRWYASTDEPDADEPYRLYSASNAGSVVGLLSYPFLIEPLVDLPTQALGWSVGYGLLILLVGAAALQAPRTTRSQAPATPAPGANRALWWMVCAAIPASLLVTMTANITADIAPVPLLWVVPLVAYLASHIWVFSRRAPSHRSAQLALVAAVVPYTALQFFELSKPWWFFAPLAVVILGVVSVAYHGEMVRTRPAAEHLTWFYLCTALGGVLGGAFATFGAPMIFDTLFELRLELVLALAVLPMVHALAVPRRVVVGSVMFIAVIAAFASISLAHPKQLTVPVAVAVAIVVAHAWDRRAGFVGLAILAAALLSISDPVATARSAYGRYRIASVTNQLGEFHELIVGTVSHGAQARDESIRKLPLSYYHPSGPIGQVLRDPIGDGPLGVIGLGVGAAAAYARDDRPVQFYELDPLVLTLAQNPAYFTHLATCGKRCSVVIGDGRLGVAALPDHSIAVLVVDAFSGDAIPTHLLTVEAFRMYQRKLRPGGAILVNGSNMYVDIAEVVANAGAATGMRAVEQNFWPREAHLRALQVAASDWILLTADATAIDRFAADPRWRRMNVADAEAAWTDDWQNLFAHYIWM